jgi:hypothetical protein
MPSFGQEIHHYASQIHRAGAGASRALETSPLGGRPPEAGAALQEMPYSLIL